MEMEKVFHMNAGPGDTSDAKNSSLSQVFNFNSITFSFVRGISNIYMLFHNRSFTYRYFDLYVGFEIFTCFEIAEEMFRTAGRGYVGGKHFIYEDYEMQNILHCRAGLFVWTEESSFRGGINNKNPESQISVGA